MTTNISVINKKEIFADVTATLTTAVTCLPQIAKHFPVPFSSEMFIGTTVVNHTFSYLTNYYFSPKGVWGKTLNNVGVIAFTTLLVFSASYAKMAAFLSYQLAFQLGVCQVASKIVVYSLQKFFNETPTITNGTQSLELQSNVSTNTVDKSVTIEPIIIEPNNTQIDVLKGQPSFTQRDNEVASSPIIEKIISPKDKPSQQFSGLQLVKASNFEEVQASVRASLLLPPIEEENSGVSQEFIDTKKNKPSISLISSSTTCCNKKSLFYTLVAFFYLVIGYQKGLFSTAPTQKSSSTNRDIDKKEHQDIPHYDGYDKEQHTRTCPLHYGHGEK